MKFFVPFAADAAEAERVYRAIAAFNSAPVEERRIWRLQWRHNGMDMKCAVGGALPSYYGTGSEPVLAILKSHGCYLICTPNRGGARGGPVIAGDGEGTLAECFEQ